MFKRLLCLIVSAVSLFALCSCNGNEKSEETTAEKTTEFESFVISKDNTNLIEKGADIPVQAEDSYCVLKYNDKQYIVKQLESGNFEALYTLGESCELLDEATKRADGKYIYFTENSSLKAYFIPTGTVLTIVKAPCSNFVTLNVSENFEVYPYGFIATSSEICVVNLTSGSISSYTKSVEDMKSYIDAPERLIGEKTRTTLSAHSKTGVLLTVETLSSKGEVQETEEILFTPLLGVFRKSK